jgi:LiaI-LiaF-like transmembrane region
VVGSARWAPGGPGGDGDEEFAPRRRSGALIGGVVLLVIGGVFLLRNLGIVHLDWDVLWPLLLVGVGLAIVLRALFGSSRDGAWGGRWGGGPAGSANQRSWDANQPGSPSWGDGDARVTVPAEGASRLELSLRLGAGRYRLRGGAAALVDASASEPTIHHAVDRAGDLARVRLSTSLNPLAWGWHTGMDWAIGVSSGVPVVLDIQAGAGTFDLDLSDVAIASASMAIGAAELRVLLPRPRGDVPIRVEGGAASFTFQIPAGVQARVTSTGLISTRGPTETPGYATATDRVSVSVTGGAASVQVIPAG